MVSVRPRVNNQPLMLFRFIILISSNQIAIQSVSLELLRTLTFHFQDLIGNSPYCLPYNSYKVSSKNLVLNQLTIP